MKVEVEWREQEERREELLLFSCHDPRSATILLLGRYDVSRVHWEPACKLQRPAKVPRLRTPRTRQPRPSSTRTASCSQRSTHSSPRTPFFPPASFLPLERRRSRSWRSEAEAGLPAHALLGDGDSGGVKKTGWTIKRRWGEAREVVEQARGQGAAPLLTVLSLSASTTLLVKSSTLDHLFLCWTTRRLLEL